MSQHILIEMRPSIKSLFWECWYQAKGLTWRDAFWYSITNWPKCYICSRKVDFIFNLTKTITIWDESLQKVERVCLDHGGIWWDCHMGKEYTFVTIPYWQRSIRNTIYSLVLITVTLTRFIWFFSYHLFMWYVYLFVYLQVRNATTHKY